MVDEVESMQRMEPLITCQLDTEQLDLAKLMLTCLLNIEVTVRISAISARAILCSSI